MGGEDGSTTREATALMMLAAAADGLQPTASFEERRPLNPMEGFRRRVSAAGAPPPPVFAMLQQLGLLVSSLGAGLGAGLECRDRPFWSLMPRHHPASFDDAVRTAWLEAAPDWSPAAVASEWISRALSRTPRA